jgi:hypothetical protein
MEVKALRWLLLAINAYSFNNTDEARYKAEALFEVAHRLDEKAKAEAEATGKE